MHKVLRVPTSENTLARHPSESVNHLYTLLLEAVRNRQFCDGKIIATHAITTFDEEDYDLLSIDVEAFKMERTLLFNCVIQVFNRSLRRVTEITSRIFKFTNSFLKNFNENATSIQQQMVDFFW